MDRNTQMATSSAFKTLRELYDEPSEDEILARLKVAAAEFLPDGWEEWKVREGVVVDLDPSHLNKLRFCLPAMDIARAFDPDAVSLQERPYRDMKVKMLSWPFCQGLVLGPPSLAMQIRGSALQYELVSQASLSVKGRLLTRKEASRNLSEDRTTDSEFEGSAKSGSKRPMPANSTRLKLLEQESRETRSLLEQILARLDDQTHSSSEQEEEEQEDGDQESTNDSIDNCPWSPPKEQTLFDFTPRTKEQEPSVPEPSQEMSLQGIECQRLGKETWNKIRYSEVQKKFHAYPVFGALKVNPQLKHLSHSSSQSDFLEKTEESYGTITHALLLQRAAFSRAINKAVELYPEALTAINSELLSTEGEFKNISDSLLQFVCGKRAEAIELRRKALTPLNSNISTSLMKIPPSTQFLFDEAKLDELSKLPSSSFDASKAQKQFKRNYDSHGTNEKKLASPAKKAKFVKKTSKQEEAKQNRSTTKKSVRDKYRRPRTGRRF